MRLARMANCSPAQPEVMPSCGILLLGSLSEDRCQTPVVASDLLRLARMVNCLPASIMVMSGSGMLLPDSLSEDRCQPKLALTLLYSESRSAPTATYLLLPTATTIT